jgi:DNA-binding transcriptional ArsR family regulator
MRLDTTRLLYNSLVVDALTEDELDLTFAALADPTRRSILARLVDGEATVNELAAPFAMSQQAVSRHIKVLETAGLISRSVAAQARPCRLEPARLDGAAAWIARHRQLWAERYDRLDAHLATLSGREPGPSTSPTEQETP